MPEMNNVAEYVLYSTRDKSESVALEACEFWLTFAEDPDLAGCLRPLLAKVAPVMLECMAYGEEDILWLDADATQHLGITVKNRMAMIVIALRPRRGI